MLEWWFCQHLLVEGKGLVWWTCCGWQTDLHDRIQPVNVLGLRSDFKDLVTSLSTKVDPISYIDLHSSLLTHEFLHKATLQLAVTTPLLPTPTQQPAAFFVQHHSNFNTGRQGCLCGGWRHNNRNNSYHGNGSAQNFSTHIYTSGQQFGQ
jgi:hypothetical protein